MEDISHAPEKEGDAQCALLLALDVFGERWSFLILRSVFNGIGHFEEFQRELHIARNILSNRLSRLVEHGILDRTVMSVDRRRVRYELTEKGRELGPAMLALRKWGEKWIKNAGGSDRAATGRRYTRWNRAAETRRRKMSQ